MEVEKNLDICVVIDVNEDEGQLTLYSPLEKENITVEVEYDVLDSISTEDGVAFEVDLNTRKIV